MERWSSSAIIINTAGAIYFRLAISVGEDGIRRRITAHGTSKIPILVLLHQV